MLKLTLLFHGARRKVVIDQPATGFKPTNANSSCFRVTRSLLITIAKNSTENKCTTPEKALFRRSFCVS